MGLGGDVAMASPFLRTTDYLALPPCRASLSGDASV